MVLWFHAITILMCACHALCDVVKTTQGHLRGTVRTSRNGQPFYAFLAVPYATPPVGDLRFKESLPHPGWEGERDASTESPVCPQDMPYFPEMGDQIYGQEDCLYLNVYTPQLNPAEKLPVMVFFHGGGFLMGQTTSDFYGPEYFMDHNVVLVTLHYRLGVLGFLSFSNEEFPGNLGLKDQVLALKWVQQNIADFGGDPDSVTIFGESAGAASVSYHLVSPLTEGLFHKAILQSGTYDCLWALIPQDLARDRGLAFATLVGCPTTPMETVLDCLRQLPVETFVQAAHKFYIWNQSPMIRFGPVIEPSHAGNNFLPRNPLDLPHKSVPIINGLNFKEGGIIAAPFCANNYELGKALSSDLERLLPHTLCSAQWTHPGAQRDFVAKMKQFYLAGQDIGEDNLDGLNDMVTDVLFAHPAIATTLKHKSYSPAYFYLYNYEMPISLNTLFGNCSQSLGVGHGDELVQLFNMSIFKDYTLTSEEKLFSESMLGLWTSFARTGVPENPDWLPVTSHKLDYLYISRNTVILQRGLFEERMNFLDTLLPLDNFKKSLKHQGKTEL